MTLIYLTLNVSFSSSYHSFLSLMFQFPLRFTHFITHHLLPFSISNKCFNPIMNLIYNHHICTNKFSLSQYIKNKFLSIHPTKVTRKEEEKIENYSSPSWPIIKVIQIHHSFFTINKIRWIHLRHAQHCRIEKFS